MCGIAGVVSWDERFRTSRETLARMSASIAHRGPDGEGLWFNHEGPITPERPQVALAFRRLAILDPDPRAMQPMHSPDGRFTMVFNGEIYNFRDLKAEISKLKPDYAWRTTGDSEVLLMAYATWGPECLEKLNGMFAIAIWDEQEKSLFLARDRMGQKPLYVDAFLADPLNHRSRKWLCFASEPQALQSMRRSARTDLIGFLRNGWVDAGVAPSNFYLTEPRWIEEYLYFGPNEHSSLSATSEKVRIAVDRAVQRQLISDVPLGVFLSGGVDSSVVALCARKQGPVQTFSIAFDDPRYDESSYAREVAKHLGTEHHEFHVTPNVIEDLPKLVRVFGEPFADSSMIPTHYLARETRKHVKVALSGDGGDELFGGYERYEAMRLSRGWVRFIPRGLAKAAGTACGLLGDKHPKSRLTRAARFLKSLRMDEADRYDSYLRIFDDATIDALLKNPRSDPLLRRSVASTYSEMRETRGPVEAALATDRVTYLPNDLLTKVDRCSMLHALEVRSPFMDHELVQLAATLTEDQLLKGGKKRMLREAFAKDLPDSVFKRPKMGFAVPIGEWFRGELRSFLRDHLFAADSFGKEHFGMKVVERLVDEHESQRRDHSQRLFALLVLEIWWKQQRDETTEHTEGTERNA